MSNYFWVIKGVVETERTFNLQKDWKYTFLVDSNSNKIEIWKAIEYLYWVNVKSVNTIKVRKKTRLIWRWKIFTKRHAWVKAIVTLEEWEKIDFAALNFKEDKKKKKSN